MNLNTLLTLSIEYKLYPKAPRVSWVTLSTFVKILENISLWCHIIVHEMILVDACHLSLTDPSKQAALEKVFLNLLAGFHPRRGAPFYRCSCQSPEFHIICCAVYARINQMSQLLSVPFLLLLLLPHLPLPSPPPPLPRPATLCMLSD